METVKLIDSKKSNNSLINLCTVVGLGAVIIFIYYGYKNGLFSSAETFKSFVAGFGIWAALIFILIQIVQVILPILPGAVGCVAGIVIFGPWMGFLYNYIGICIGSVIVFILSRRYGEKFVKGIVGQKSFDKYIGWSHKGKKFDKIFAYAIFFPFAPDDLLCYIAGLTKMTLKKFVTIILLGKPMSIAIYSMGIAAIGQYLISLI